jgi:hypothetical protein
MSKDDGWWGPTSFEIKVSQDKVFETYDPPDESLRWDETRRGVLDFFPLLFEIILKQGVYTFLFLNIIDFKILWKT